MYRQSFLIVVLSIILMGVVFAGSRFVAAIPGVTGLPSSYDPKISVEDAVQTSKNPLLIEFYTDTCNSCQYITPWVHDLSKKYRNDLTFVMVNVEDPKQVQIAQIFGIQFVPSIFVFDFKHMNKQQISVASYRSKEHLDKAIGKALRTVQNEAKSRPKRA